MYRIVERRFLTRAGCINVCTLVEQQTYDFFAATPGSEVDEVFAVVRTVGVKAFF